MSKKRRLFEDLDDSARLFHQLAPMAHQNLSWVGAVTHHVTIPSTGEDEDGVAGTATADEETTTTTGTTTTTNSKMSPATTTAIGALIWKETLHQVHTFPRRYSNSRVNKI